jgi:hypothetical protein
MARENKAERLAREAAAREAFEAEQAATYPERLMAMLERAQKSNFELTVEAGKFLLEDRDERDYLRRQVLTLEYNQASQETLHELDWRVEMKEEAEREAERKAQLRLTALNKLSREERELLGL